MVKIHNIIFAEIGPVLAAYGSARPLRKMAEKVKLIENCIKSEKLIFEVWN